MAAVPKEGLYILLALVCGGIGFFALRQYVDAQVDEYRKQFSDQQELVVLKVSVNPGQVLTKEMLDKVPVPATFAHKRAVKWSEQGGVIGNMVKSPVAKGEVLLWYAMDMGASASLSEKIPEGEKAITIPVNNVTGGGGMVRPNMRVDVYGIFRMGSKSQNEESSKSEVLATKLLENVAVVAVGTEAGTDYGGISAGAGDKASYNSVTILVKTKDVEKVLLAQELAKASGTGLYCIYRSEMETRRDEKQAAVISAREFLESLGVRKQTKGAPGKVESVE